MGPGNLTLHCVDFNKMSIERTFYCNLVAGLNLWASLIIKVMTAIIMIMVSFPFFN